MARVICIANQKGGVGKTTTAINLADGLARSGAETLLVDLDPQCNATTGLGCEAIDDHPLAGERAIRGDLAETYSPHLRLLPGTRNPGSIEKMNDPDRDVDALGRRLKAAAAAFDFVLFDCPPSMGRLTETALAASDEVLMPIQCEYFAMEGLAEMIRLIGRVISERPGDLQFGGIVLTMVDHSLELTAEVDAEVREFFGEIVYKTVIPRDVAVCEAPSHGQSVLRYAPRSRGSRAYVELCMEVLERD